MRKIYLTIILIMLWAIAHPAVAGHPIASAQFTDSGMIRVTLDDGRVIDVPDNMANRHRRQVSEWIAAGNTITPADPPTPLTRQQRIRRDPDYPKPAEFMEAIIDCRFNSDCRAAQVLRQRLANLRIKYP